MPASRERDAVPHRGERILQTAALAHVHVHVAGGGERQPERARRARGTCETFAIAAVTHELDRDPGAAGERARDPFALIRAPRAASGGSHSASVPAFDSPTNSSTSARVSA